MPLTLTKNHFLEGDAVSALPQIDDMIPSEVGICLHLWFILLPIAKMPYNAKYQGKAEYILQ